MLDGVFALWETAWENIFIPAEISGSCLASSLKEKEVDSPADTKEIRKGFETPQ